MPWSVTSCDKLKHALQPSDTLLDLNSITGVADLCALIGSPPSKHVVLELYSAAGSEQVVAYACEAGKVKITRANAGTTAKPWPVGGCLRTIQVIDGQLCGTDSASASDCGCDSSPWEGFTVCDSFTLNMTNPATPVMCLKPTGVVAGTYCGLKVNQFGQITFIPTNFPASCLPVFDPCGDCGGAGGGTGMPATEADVVEYMPQVGANIVIANNVQLAIEQLEDYIQANTGGSIGVTSVEGATPITVTGSATTRTVTHDASPLSAGTYNGFTVDGWGHITGYTATAGGLTINGTGGLNASSINPNVWDLSLAQATSTTYGAVKFIPNGTIGSGGAILTTSAVSYGNLTEWWTTKINFLCSQPSASPLALSDKLVVCQSGSTVIAPIADVGTLLGVPHARLHISGAAISYGHNIAAVTSTLTSHTVVMSAPTTSGKYQVIIERGDGAFAYPKVTRSGATAFVIEWVELFTTATTTALDPALAPSELYVTVIGG